MRSCLIVASCFTLAVCTLAAGQEPAVEEAAPVAEATAAPTPENGSQTAEKADAPGTLEFRFDDIYKAADASVSRQIDVDLIDIEELRQAIDVGINRAEIRLSLNDCILVVLDRNPDILVAEFEPLKADADLLSARGQFDPILGTDILYSETSAVASQQIIVFGGISSIESFNTTATTSISGQLHTGTIYNIALAMDKEESVFGKFIEEWNGMLTFTLTQPVLRGFGATYNKVRIKQAKNLREAAEAQLAATTMQTVSEAVKAYWDLVGAIERVNVSEEALANAERLLHINETRRQIGTAADIDVLQAKTGVATRQSELIATRAAVGVAEDALKKLLDIRDGDFFSTARIIPTDRPHMAPEMLVEPGGYESALQVSVDRALKNRPELKVSEVEIENAKLEETRTRNEMLPQLDVTGAYGQGGRDHKPRQVFYGMRQGEADVMSVGVQGSIPIGNRAARGQYQRAEITRRQAEQRFESVRQSLMAAVHLALRNVFTNQTLVESTRQAREFQEVNVTAEEKRLRLGVTTSYQVLLVQQDLTAAQTQEVQAMIDYEKALVDLQLAEGTLLGNLGVEFEAPAAEKPIGYIKSVRPRWE